MKFSLLKSQGQRDALVFLADSIFLVISSFFIATSCLLVFTVIALHFPDPPTEGYCRNMCGDQVVPNWCTVQFCNFGNYFFTELFEVPFSFLGAPYVYWESFPGRARTRKRTIVFITVSIIVIALVADFLQVYVVEYYFLVTEIIYFFLLLAIFSDKSRLRDYVLIVLANALPPLSGIICVQIVILILPKMASEVITVTYIFPTLFFLLACATERCLTMLVQSHGDAIHVDATLFKMYIICELVQLISSVVVGKDVLTILFISTLGSCFGYVLTLAWHTPRFRKMMAIHMSEVYPTPLRKIKKRAIRIVAPGREEEKKAAAERDHSSSGSSPPSRPDEVASNGQRCGGKFGAGKAEAASCMWKRMAINMVMATFCAVGLLVALLLFRGLFFAKILPNDECYWPELSFISSVRFKADYLWFVIVVSAVLLLFVNLLEMMKLGLLETWRNDRVSLIRVAIMIQVLYGPYFLVWLLLNMLNTRPQC